MYIYIHTYRHIHTYMLCPYLCINLWVTERNPACVLTVSSLHSLANLYLDPHTLANWCAAGQNLRRNVFKIHSIRLGIEHLFWNWSLGIWQALSCIAIILVKFENPCVGTKDSRKLLEFEVWDEDACSVDDFLGKATFHSKRRGGSGLGLSVSYGVGEIPLDECAAFMLQVVAVVANFYLLCFKQYPRSKSGAVLMQSRNRERRRRQKTTPFFWHPSSDTDPALSGLFLTKFSRETWNSQVHLHKARNKGETHDQNWDGRMSQSSATHWQDRHGCRTLDASWIWSAGSIRVRIKVLKTYDYGLMSTFCCCRLVAKCWTNIVCWLEIPDALPKVMTALAPLLYRVAEQQTLRRFTTYWVG